MYDRTKTRGYGGSEILGKSISGRYWAMMLLLVVQAGGWGFGGRQRRMESSGGQRGFVEIAAPIGRQR